MTYSLDYRKQVTLKSLEDGMTFAEAASFFMTSFQPPFKSGSNGCIVRALAMLRHQKYRMMHYAKTLSVTLMTITMREQDGSTVLPQPFVRL